jgi:hypothetical protein
MKDDCTMRTFFDIEGSGGKSPESHTPTEDPNNLLTCAIGKTLEVLCEGEIKGLAGQFIHDPPSPGRSIFLDNTPLFDDDGNRNFKGANFNFRYGLPEQDPIAGFPAIENETPLSLEVRKGTPITRIVDNVDTDDLRLKFMVPSFFEVSKANGDTHGSKVELTVEIQPDGGSWSAPQTVTIEGKTNTAYETEIILKDLSNTYGAGPWSVRVTRVTLNSGKGHIQNQTYWESFTTVINERFSWPHVAYVGVEAHARQFGSKVPNTAYDIFGLCKLYIPTNYDPETRAYTGIWDGTFKTDWTDNPAWIFYDLCTNSRYGLGLEPQYVNKWVLYQIAKYCDELVPDGAGGMEPRFTCNLYLQSQEDAFQVLNALASCFRAMPYWSSGMVSLGQDSPRDPTHIATPANVKNGHFEYSGTGLSARHSVAMVTWNDPDDSMKAAVEPVPDRDLIHRYGYKPIDVLAVGCTRRSQAIRQGKWILDSEKNERASIHFVGGQDFCDAVPGCLIQVHDPRWAGVRFGGRAKPAVQNILKQSNTFSVSPWTKNNSSIQGTNPQKLVEDTSALSHYMVQQPNPVLSDNTVYCFSAEIKAAERFSGYVKIRTKQNVSIYCAFRLDTLALNVGGSPVSYGIAPTSDGFYRVWVSGDVSSGATVPQVWITLYNASGVSGYQGDGSSGFYVRNTQLNLGSDPFDYVETESVAATELNTVRLDAPVTLVAGQEYTLSVVMPDKSIGGGTVVNSAGTWEDITLSAALAEIPLPGAVWMLSAPNLQPRYFSVLSNTESAPHEYEIAGIEHDSTKFARVEQNLKIEAPPTSLIPTGVLQPPDHVTIDTFTYEIGSNWKMGVTVGWKAPTDPRVTWTDVDFKENTNGDWRVFAHNVFGQNSVERRDILPGLYDFRVRHRGVGKSDWLLILAENVDNPATVIPSVQNLRVQGGGTEFKGMDLVLAWDDITAEGQLNYMPPARLRHYLIRVKLVDGTVKNVYKVKGGIEQFTYRLNNHVEDFGTPTSPFKISIVAVDHKNQSSDVEAEITVTSANPAVITGLQIKGGGVAFNEPDANLEWTSPISAAYPERKHSHYRVRVKAIDDTIKRTRVKPGTDESFAYPYAANVQDFGGDGLPSFKVGVSAVNVWGGVGAETVVTVNNPMPTMAAITPDLDATFDGIQVEWTNYAEPKDSAGFKILCDTSNPPTTQIKRVGAGTDGFKIKVKPASTTTYYVRIVPVDVFRAGTGSVVASVSVKVTKAVAAVDANDRAIIDFSQAAHVSKTAANIAETVDRKWAAESGATVGARAGTNLFDSLGNALDDAKVVTGKFATGAAGTNRIVIYDHASDGYIAGIDSSNVIQAQLRASDGKFIAGGGDVVLDDAGITVMMASAWAAKNSYKMLSGGVRRCEWYALDDGSVIDMFLFANGGSDRDARIVINASPTTADHEGTLTISASKLGAQSAVTLTTESIRISTPGSVDVGSASTGFHFDASSRIVLGGAPSSMSATNIMTVRNGTPPPTNVTDAFTMYSYDQAAGNACPHFRCEDGSIIKLYKQVAMTPDNGYTFTSSWVAASATQANNMNDRIQQLENALKLLGIKP